MKCPYCYREVEPTKQNTCPVCHAALDINETKAEKPVTKKKKKGE